MKPGIYPDIPAADYHADPCDAPSLSSSIARTLLTKSPLHAWLEHPKLGNQPKETKAIFDIGHAAHSLLLEGEDAMVVVEADSWRTKDAKAARDEAHEVGKVPVLPEQAKAVRAMVKAAHDQLNVHEEGNPFERDGEAEETLIWQDGYGVWCRVRTDWRSTNGAIVYDYKSTYNARPDKWERTMYGMQGDVQAAFYLRGIRALTGEYHDWRWIVQETSPPYALSVCTLTRQGMELAKRKVDSALDLWAECLESGQWPAYSPRVAYIDPPSWQEVEQLSRELNADDEELEVPL